MIIKGDILYNKDKDQFETIENGYLCIENGKVEGVYTADTLPSSYEKQSVEDHTGCLIIPGFCDTHAHAPQWSNCGMGYSLELLPWLDTYTFPIEKEFEKEAFAEHNYTRFVEALKKSGTTRISLFATRHLKATKLLVEKLEKSGLGAYVGKVNMDRNSMEGLQEETKQSLYETEQFINWVKERNPQKDALIQPIVTPRFVPSTTSELMHRLGKITEQYGCKVQSHLCENKSEIAWVKKLHPKCDSFTSVYYDYGLLPKGRTVMAHCVHNTEKELELLQKQQVYIAHSPASNINLSSGIMPLRKYLDEGQLVTLASDISGGHALSMRVNIIQAIQMSKVNQLMHPEQKAITFTEAFYLATMGSGSFFGKVGSFLPGYEADVQIIDDASLDNGLSYSVAQRVERYIYAGNDACIKEIYVRGKKSIDNSTFLD